MGTGHLTMHVGETTKYISTSIEKGHTKFYLIVKYIICKMIKYLLQNEM